MSYANLSSFDRGIRIALGLLMLIAGWAGWVPGVWDIALLFFAWVPLATGILGWCPFYALLGIRTNLHRAPRS
jgi:hypothetical protein